MKKQILWGVMLIATLLGMSSCEQNVVNNANWKIIDCNVGYSQWRYTKDDSPLIGQYDNNYYYASFDVPSLSKFIFTDGNVQVYLIETNSSGEDIQRPLPFSRHVETWVGEERLFYTETYDYFYGVGWVEFNYTASDFAYEDSNGTKPECHPTDKKFRVVTTW